MSAVYDAFNDDDSRVGRALTFAAHLMLYAAGVVAVCVILSHLGLRHPLIRLGSDLALGLFLVGMLHNGFTRLCVRCMQEVPADASARAAREWWVLKINHEAARGFGLVYTALFIAAGVLVRRLDLPQVARLPIDAVMIAYMYSIWLHHRLRPWCKYCPKWDDDGGIPEPSPDPALKTAH